MVTDLTDVAIPNDLFNSGKSFSVILRPNNEDSSSRSLLAEAMSCWPRFRSLAEIGSAVVRRVVARTVVVVVEVVFGFVVWGRAGINLANSRCGNQTKGISQCQSGDICREQDYEVIYAKLTKLLRKSKSCWSEWVEGSSTLFSDRSRS